MGGWVCREGGREGSAIYLVLCFYCVTKTGCGSLGLGIPMKNREWKRIWVNKLEMGFALVHFLSVIV